MNSHLEPDAPEEVAGLRFYRLFLLHQTSLALAVFLAIAGLWPRGMLFAGTPIPSSARQAANEGRAIWVFLRDKGPASEIAKLAGGQWISERARARIRQRGAPYDAQDDWPVFSGYKELLTVTGMTIRNESRWLNAVAGTIAPASLEALAELGCVKSVRPVAVYKRRQPDAEGIPQHGRSPFEKSSVTQFDYGMSAAQIEAIQADRLHEIGLDGSGVRIGFLDTGFDLSIAAFDSLRVIDAYDFINGDPDVGDDNLTQMSHGTATLSVCGGFVPGELIGVAPRAEYALAKTEIVAEEIATEEDCWVAGIEWLDGLGCDLASSSLGYTKWYTYADMDGNSAITTIEADKAAARGMLVVNSAGNEGNKTWHYIIAPADGDSTLAVGATTIAGVRVPFSSVGPTADGRVKPDVMAPGVGVWSANPGSNTFSGKEGTSFSAPLVTGVCALLVQQNPGLTPYGLITLLRETATNADRPDTLMGWGIVQAAWAAGLDVANPNGTHVELWPNPMDDLVRIVLPESDPEGQARFWVYTASGQLVFTGDFSGHSVTWRGRNDEGGSVASGVYLVLVRTTVREETIKLAVLRR